MSYVIKVGRMQLLNKWVFIGVPLTVMGSALLLVILIGAVFVPGSEPFYTGAGQAPLWYFLAVGIQALTLTFPFSQGMSITRRNYYLGTLSTFALVALVFAVLFFLLSLVEKATHGWFVGGFVFALPWVSDGPWYGTVGLVWMVAYLLFCLGFWGATIYKRWSVTGLLVATLGAAVVLLAIAAIFTLSHRWGLFVQWASGQTPLSVAAEIAVLVLVLAGGSYLTLRRATP